MPEKKSKIMVFGTFDGLHKGHQNFLQQAQTLAEQIIIIIARDQNVENIKGKKTLLTEAQRLQAVQNTFPSAKVELGHSSNFYQKIEEHLPQIIALGYDQKANLKELQTLFPQIRIIRLKSYQPQKYKSSLLNQCKK